MTCGAAEELWSRDKYLASAAKASIQSNAVFAALKRGTTQDR
jgi:hypothetical protein